MTTHNKDKELELLRQEVNRLRTQNEQLSYQCQTAQKTIQHNQAFLDRFIDVVYSTDINGNIIYVNQAAERQLGYKLSDVQGKHFRHFIHPDYLEQATQYHQQTLTDGYSAAESVLIDKWGNQHPVEIVGVINEQKGQPIGTQGVIRDISQRKKAEDILEKNQEMMKALLDAITESVLLIDLNGDIQAANQTCADRLKCQVEDLLGKNASQFFPPGVYQGRMAKGFEVLASGHPIRFTDERAGMFFDNTVYPVTNRQQKIERLVIFARDVTALKQAEDELSVYRNQMAKAERLASAGTLSAMVAHELSQPLTVIRLSVQNALAELVKDQDISIVRSDLDHCLESVSHVSNLVDRFRDYARTVLERRRSEVQLAPILKKSLELMHEAYKVAQVTTNVQGMDALPPIWACPTDLDQLFFIFLENVFQAADPHKEHQLVIIGQATQDRIEIRFEDDCGGVPMEHENRLFEPFFTTKPQGTGTGLGLCVAERIVQEIGGRITLENRPGQGTAFILQFPITGKQ